MLRKLIYLHPIFFLFASMLFLYPSAEIIASPAQIFRPLLILSLLLLMLAQPAYWLTRDRHVASILLSIFVLGFLSDSTFFFRAGVTSLTVLLLWEVAARLRKWSIKMGHASALLALTSFIFMALTTASLLPSLSALPVESDLPALPIVKLHSLDARPDIYYILVDGYARADVLKELYGFDNSAFIDNLESKGFIIPVQSSSNYAKTVFSVTSTLNMDYLNELAPKLKDQNYWWLISPYFDRSQARLALEEIGYQTVSISSSWTLTDNPTTDVYYSPKLLILSDFESLLLSRTPLGAITLPLFEKIAFVPSYNSHREAVLYTLKTLGEIPSESGPKFVFAHIFAPHPPFVFGVDGEPVEPGYEFGFLDGNQFPYSDEKYRDGYVEQVQFINQNLLTVVDRIIRASNTPPIIILQADHGPRMLGDFGSLKDTCLKESFSTFSAYYLPGQDETIIPRDITSVNLFRIIFNQYFYADLPTLDSRNYFDQDVFTMVDVTDQVNTCTGR